MTFRVIIMSEIFSSTFLGFYHSYVSNWIENGREKKQRRKKKCRYIKWREGLGLHYWYWMRLLWCSCKYVLMCVSVSVDAPSCTPTVHCYLNHPSSKSICWAERSLRFHLYSTFLFFFLFTRHWIHFFAICPSSIKVSYVCIDTK